MEENVVEFTDSYFDCCSQCGWSTNDPNDFHACQMFLEEEC